MYSSRPSRQRVWLASGVLFALGILLSLAACVPASSAGQGAGSESANQGTLSGDVLAGPTCPVESAARPCPPRPVPDRQVMIQTPDGKTIATTTTDKNGHFTITLAPGNYLVQVAAVPGPYLRQQKAVQVVIIAGKTASVKILLDTGIR